MNSVTIKYKSLLTSLFIHLFIALMITAMYMKYQEKTYETRICVNLQALHYVEPKPMKTVVPQKVSKPFTKSKPIAKKIIPIVKKKVVPVKEIPVVETVILEKEIELTPVAVDEVKETVVVDTHDEVMQKELLAQAITTQNEPLVPVVNLSPEEVYMDENLAIINALIRKNLSYPRIAKKRGLQGRALVFFTIDKNGDITEIHASGEVASILKKSARKTVEKASSSFPHPQEVLSLQIPIVYKLH